MNKAYLNGEFLPLDQARISPMDRGFLLADGVYEVMPVYQGKLFWFPEHFARLQRGLDAIGLANPYSESRWLEIFERLIAQSETSTLSLYVQITRGVELVRNHFYEGKTAPTVFAYTAPMAVRGVDEISPTSAITCEDVRWGRCDIKAISLLANVLARQEAHIQGATEALLIRDGFVNEGASSNLFMIKDGVIFTAPKSRFILSGITRDVILSLARKHGVPVQECAFTLAELYAADEVWISSSIREIQPIVKVDGKLVGTGHAGLVWRALIEAFYALKTQILSGP